MRRDGESRGVLASIPVFAGKVRRILRVSLIIALLTVSAVPMLAGPASGEGKLSDLQARLDEIQGELDSTTAKLEAAHAAEETLKNRMSQLEKERSDLQEKTSRLREKVVERAAALYKSGGTSILDALLDAEDFDELTDSAEMLSRVSADDQSVFIDMARAQDRLALVEEQLADQRKRVAAATDELSDLGSELQAKFNSVAAEYEALKEELAQIEPAAATSAPAPQIKASGDMVCPVGGPTSFVDSWGAPRSGGRTHQGVDMMAAYGTPQVAIVSGTITYAGYSGIGGNVQYLSGDDGNLYIYIHQRENTVTSGHVSAGQVISYVGDTGNAAGTPHLHFEFHPGGGGAVNPYPLVASLC